MIEVFEGRIGGGKTLSAVERMLLMWKEGKTVATNIDLDWPACCALIERRYRVILQPRQLCVLSIDQVPTFWQHVPQGTRENPVLVIIDEADVWLVNSSQGGKTLPEFWNFLKQSRKMGTDVIFITQAVKNLSGQVARLAQFIWRFKDLSKAEITLPVFGTLRWPFGSQILQIQCDSDGKTVLKRRFWRKDPEFFSCYNTNALYADFTRHGALAADRVDLEKVGKPPLEIPDWVLWAALVVLLVVIFI
jgi:hypothetical protein